MNHDFHLSVINSCMIGKCFSYPKTSLMGNEFHFHLISSLFFFASASKSVSDAKTVIPLVKQPVFLRSMSAPSDLEMIANQDLEFAHATQRSVLV